MSGRSPAYVPTTSSRVRSTSIVALTVSSSSVDLPAGRGRVVGRALVRGVGRADQPVVGPRDEEDDLAGDADGQPDRVRDALARDDEVGAAARQDAQRAAAERMVGARPPRRRSRRRRPWSGSRGRLPVAMVRGLDGRDRAGRRTGAQARRADPGDRHAAGGDRGPSHGQRVAGVVLDPVVVEEPAAQAVAAGGSGRGRACRPSTGGGASRRRGAPRGRRRASGRRRRTPSWRTGCRRSGTAAARS